MLDEIQEIPRCDEVVFLGTAHELYIEVTDSLVDVNDSLGQ